MTSEQISVKNRKEQISITNRKEANAQTNTASEQMGSRSEQISNTSWSTSTLSGRASK